MRPLSLSPRACIEALGTLPGAYWLRDGERGFAGALPVDISNRIDPEPGGGPSWDPGIRSFPRWVGLLPYERFRAVEGRSELASDTRPPAVMADCLWRRYRAALVFEAGRVTVVGETEADEQSLVEGIERARPRTGADISLSWLEPPEADASHIDRVHAALDWIAAGRIYQVNLARRLRLRAAGSPIELLARLGGGDDGSNLGGARFGFAFDAGELSCVSLSPELCLSLTPDRELSTSPIKGTRPRSPIPGQDRELAAELEASDKERAELTMVIDLERNDLARVAETGSVRVSEPPRVVTHPTVHHREATVTARLREGVSREALLSAVLPSGSVTGAPKKAAMTVIRELETHRRGLYTGALGYWGQDGGLRLSMAIRSLTIHQGVAEYFVGGGIVADSDPLRELEETRWKAAQLARLVQGRFS